MFELETLKILLNSDEFRLLDINQRIQRAIKTLILEGLLHPGAKLPATRVLAHSLLIARDTVEFAYLNLHRDGFITRHIGAGSFVSEKIGADLQG